MSVRNLDLRSPQVIAVVAILLVAVAAVNVRTFGAKGSNRRQAQERVQAQPSLPADLGELVRAAGERQRNPEREIAAEAGLTQALVRDPFSGSGPQSTRQPAPADAPGRRPRPAGKALVCSAVLLSGAQPVALIGGKAYAPGQQVAGCQVLEVSLLGATLQEPDGGTVFLRVMDKPAAEGSFRVTGGGAEQDAASPVDDGLEERMPR